MHEFNSQAVILHDLWKLLVSVLAEIPHKFQHTANVPDLQSVFVDVLPIFEEVSQLEGSDKGSWSILFLFQVDGKGVVLKYDGGLTDAVTLLAW
jgi:hypothetical protein